VLLITSGYALYYFGSEESRPWISLLHWVLGLGAPLLLLWHIVSGRRTRTPAQDALHHSHSAQEAVTAIDQRAKQRRTSSIA
jgi:hypothetical protein